METRECVIPRFAGYKMVSVQIRRPRPKSGPTQGCRLCDFEPRTAAEAAEHATSEKHVFRQAVKDIMSRRRTHHESEEKRCYNCATVGHIADECPAGFCFKYATGECRRHHCPLPHRVF